MRGNAGQRKKIVEREIPVADGVQAVPGDAGKAEIARNRVAVDCERISGKGSGTHGTCVRTRRSMLQTNHVAREGFRMSKQKVREQDWLSVLHVRHARHRHVAIGFRLQQERVQQGFQGMQDLCGRINNEEAKIGSHEFVAAAAGVQLPAERTKFFDECFFDEVMYVLGCCPERFERFLYLCCRENANGPQSFRPRAINSNLIRQKTAIERKRPLESVELFVRFALKASAPQPVVFAFGHYCLLPSAFAFGRTVTGSANRLMKPSASLGL